MESIKNSKFQALSENEMNNISGGAWRTKTSYSKMHCEGAEGWSRTYTTEYNIWGNVTSIYQVGCEQV